MGRNFICIGLGRLGPQVALLVGGVGRNAVLLVLAADAEASPSSWRAWVEIAGQWWTRPSKRSPSSWRAWVEILWRRWIYQRYHLSPSSWRAWVEINLLNNLKQLASVALLVEGVGRNSQSQALVAPERQSPSSWRAWVEMISRSWRTDPMPSRPPRGGRG